jgi:2-amino-4-hydroxy-6-hydroxymethyldihydropteridine diphosphokinase
MDTLHTVYFGLGSNLGDPEENIFLAIERMGELIGSVERQSSLYYYDAWGFESEHQFVNAAVCCMTKLTPQQVLRRAQQIERELGKGVEHATIRIGGYDDANPAYRDRPIDIDILLYDNLVVDEPNLQIPHPLMRDRDFVMQPLEEILPEDYDWGDEDEN